jgi:hypothetical protein
MGQEIWAVGEDKKGRCEAMTTDSPAGRREGHVLGQRATRAESNGWLWRFLSLLMMATATVACGEEAAIDFDNAVIPVLTKAGCNTGACHGAAVGRGGLKLSLYGGDPNTDFRSIVLDLEGRRVNYAEADESLIVRKPTESMEHGGGERLLYDGEGAELLLQWIRQGTPRIRSKQLAQFDVSPRSHVASEVDQTLQLTATAQFSDGSHADVTRWTVFTAEDSSALEIDPDTAVVKLLRRGRNIVVARYLDRVVPIEIVVPLSDQVIDLSAEPRSNFVDDHVLETLSTLRLPVSPAADDATFLRRVTLDLTGRLPAIAMQDQFADNGDRRSLVGQLLDSDEFDEYWTLQLSKLLRIRSQPGDSTGALTYHRWLKQQITAGVPYDRMARDMLLAMGDTHEVGPANFYRTASGPREQAEFASELFMGNRLRCANCHNHPLDRWTQDDYHGLAAIFAKVGRGRVIKANDRGEVTHPRSGEAAVERIPGQRFLQQQDDGREALAAWLTDPENPYFARAIVNRLWKAMMGRGLVEPTDDLRDTNPPTHPALLDALSRDFVERGYDLRHTLRLIALSTSYGRSSAVTEANRADDRYYSHALSRPLQPEVLADAISDIVGVPDRYGDEPLGTRAVALFDSNIESEALDILGRCSREESCETVASSVGGLPRKLHMFNGALLNQRIRDAQGRLAQSIGQRQKPNEIVEEFYRRSLCRRPTEQEREFWTEQVATADNAREQHEVLEDFVWSLLTCREATTNH